jgi:hypothetical protein
MPSDLILDVEDGSGAIELMNALSRSGGSGSILIEDISVDVVDGSSEIFQSRISRVM